MTAGTKHIPDKYEQHIMSLCPKDLTFNERRRVRAFCKRLRDASFREKCKYNEKSSYLMVAFLFEESGGRNDRVFWLKLAQRRVMEVADANTGS